MARLVLLLIAPAPILASTMLVTSWMKSSHEAIVHRNEVSHVSDPVPGDRACGDCDELATHAAVASSDLATSSQHTSVDLRSACDQAAQALQRRLGGSCQVVSRPPLVVAGNIPAAEIEACLQDTLSPGLEALKTSYFATLPHEPVIVLLLADEHSYQQTAKSLLGDDNVSIYGYYKQARRTVVVNFSTGPGTLIHELTHALADFDFPAMPAWFNEGLASLHEQSQFETTSDGVRILGLDNWRLPILRQAIRAGRLPTIGTLVEGDFRGGDVSLNYAHARYLCRYLQSRCLLREYYVACRQQQATDPTGLKTLLEVTGARSLHDLDASFRQWIASLPELPNRDAH